MPGTLDGAGYAPRYVPSQGPSEGSFQDLVIFLRQWASLVRKTSLAVNNHLPHPYHNVLFGIDMGVGEYQTWPTEDRTRAQFSMERIPA